MTESPSTIVSYRKIYDFDEPLYDRINLWEILPLNLMGLEGIPAVTY